MLPENTDVLNNVPPSIETRAQRQGKAIKRFMAAIDTIEDGTFTDEDFAELENNRANTHTVLSSPR